MEEFLRERLRPTEIPVPGEIDRAILGAARRTFRFRRWAPVAAVAALVLVGLGLLMRSAPPDPLDIVDAYRLSLLLERGDPIDAASDVNGDGVVDTLDVDAIVRACVALPKEPR